MRYKIFGSANPTMPVAQHDMMQNAVDSAWEIIKSSDSQTFKIVDNLFNLCADVACNRDGGPVGMTVDYFRPIDNSLCD